MIYLRELSRKDISTINGWRNDKEIVNLLGANFRYINIETDEKWFDNYMSTRSTNVRCAICLEEDNKLIGLVNLTAIDQINQNAEFHIMIGNKEYQNKGIGVKAGNLIMDHAFRNLNLSKVYSHIISDNLNSIKLHEKLGFIKEGELRNHIYKNGEFKTVNIMSVFR